MELDSNPSEIEVTPGLEGLSRTLRVAEVIRRKDLDFVSKPGELVESEFETGSLSAAARKAFALMLRKAGPDAGETKTFTITKKELRGSHKGNERIQTVMDELLRAIVRIRTTSKKGKPAVMSQSLLASCVEEISEDGMSVVEFEFSDNFKRVIQRSDYYARVNLGVMLALQSRYSLPLRAVADRISREGLTPILRILVAELRQRFGIAKPRILVCGLNPHAGEGGYLGWEEQEIIAPLLATLREQGMDLIGPLPADTAFLS